MRPIGKGFIGLLFLALLGGCHASISVDGPDAKRVYDDVLKEYRGPLGPSRIEMLGLWRSHGDADGLICGEFKAPISLQSYRDRLRFVENLPGQWVHIESHELVVGDPSTMAIINATQTVFEKMWADDCASYRPKAFLGLF